MEHSHSDLFTYYLWLLTYHKDRVEYPRNCMTHKTENIYYLVLLLLKEKEIANCCAKYCSGFYLCNLIQSI